MTAPPWRVSREATQPIAPDVRVAILLREAEALREVGADGVAVEVLDDDAALVELGADDVRDRRLADPERPVNQSVKPPARPRSDSGCSCA